MKFKKQLKLILSKEEYKALKKALPNFPIMKEGLITKLALGFCWANTKQGHTFWQTIHRKVMLEIR